MHCAKVDDVFFIKEGTFFRSIFGDDFYSATIEFIEWLLDVEFDILLLDDYIKQIKERGYSHVVVPSVCDFCRESLEDTVNSMPDESRVVTMYIMSAGEQVCNINVDKSSLIALSKYEGSIEDSIVYISDMSSVVNIFDFISKAF